MFTAQVDIIIATFAAYLLLASLSRYVMSNGAVALVAGTVVPACHCQVGTATDYPVIGVPVPARLSDFSV